MQKTNPEPIYYYRLNYDTEEALHKSIYRNELKGNTPLVINFEIINFNIYIFRNFHFTPTMRKNQLYTPKMMRKNVLYTYYTEKNGY